MKNLVSTILLICSILAAIAGAVIGLLAVLQKLPHPSLKRKRPIQRFFQRGEGELRRGMA